MASHPDAHLKSNDLICALTWIYAPVKTNKRETGETKQSERGKLDMLKEDVRILKKNICMISN